MNVFVSVMIVVAFSAPVILITIAAMAVLKWARREH